MNPRTAQIALRGPSGEPVDFLRCLLSHGVADLPPFQVDRHNRTLTVTLALGGTMRTVVIASDGGGGASIRVLGKPVGAALGERIRAEVRRVLRLDEDLAAFYAMASKDPNLSWVISGAGRMIRSQTVFEDVIKTVCTTNCAWSATERMVGALVAHLGEPAPGAPRASAIGRAFPTPEALADTDERFYRDVARTGYRGAYIRSIARHVVRGDLDLSALDKNSSARLSDAETERRLLELPGVGPYAAAHIMTMLGRYSRLILDSWTRPTYARLVGKKAVRDAAIVRRFRPYREFAGLAFWLMLTRDWVRDP